MKQFLNEEKKQFKDLSDEEMLAIVKAKIAGTCEVLMLSQTDWAKQQTEHIALMAIYRTKPQKQLAIPWSVLKKDIKHVAMDKDGSVFGYSCISKKESGYWYGEIRIDRNGCHK